MTRPNLIAKLILTAMGIRLFVWFVSIACTPLFRYPNEFLSVTFFASAESLVLLVASLFLLFCSEGLVKIITGPDSDLCEKVDIRWVAAGFQMTFCFCGLLMIYSCLTRLFYYIPAIFREPILSYTTLQGQEALFLQRSLAGGFETIIDSFIAVYLIFGAPHYIRWQLRKLSAKESNQIIGVEKYE